jgi:hypothetical protein
MIRCLPPGARALATVAWLVAGSAAAFAQTPAPGDPSQRPTETAEEKARRERDLKAVNDAMALSAETRRRLEAEIAEIKNDRVRLSTALIETAARVRATEERVRSVEERLQVLVSSEGAIRRSLEGRRGLIVEVFAALQRMGRRPPPAVLVRPEDMLEAVRASILLGAVLPELRAEAQILATDLSELVRLKNAIAADRQALTAELDGLRGEQERLAGPKNSVFRGPGPTSAAREWPNGPRFRGGGRLWRNDARHLGDHPSEGRRGIPGRRVGGLCWAFPVLRPTLDHQCRRGILSSSGRHGPNQR